MGQLGTPHNVHTTQSDDLGCKRRELPVYLVEPSPTGKPGRPRKAFKSWPAGAVYATVDKTYAKGTVTAVERKLVHGTPEDLAAALEKSKWSTTINTSFVERHNGTDRGSNARKARKTYEFSKDLLVHVAATWWGFFCYNFRHLHRGLRVRNADGTFLHRTPAMAIGIARTPMSIAEILRMPVVTCTPSSKVTLASFARIYARRAAL